MLHVTSHCFFYCGSFLEPKKKWVFGTVVDGLHSYMPSNLGWVRVWFGEFELPSMIGFYGKHVERRKGFMGDRGKAKCMCMYD